MHNSEATDGSFLSVGRPLAVCGGVKIGWWWWWGARGADGQFEEYPVGTYKDTPSYSAVFSIHFGVCVAFRSNGGGRMNAADATEDDGKQSAIFFREQTNPYKICDDDDRLGGCMRGGGDGGTVGKMSSGQLTLSIVIFWPPVAARADYSTWKIFWVIPMRHT